MKDIKKYTFFAFIALIIHIVLCFLLFINTQKILQASNIDNPNKFYLLIALILLTGLLLFVLVVLVSNLKENAGFNYRMQISNLEDDSKAESKVQEKTKDEAEINIDHFIKKTLPKDSSKLTTTKFTEKILSNLAKEFDFVQGLFFIREKGTNEFNLSGKYAYFGDTDPEGFKIGETLSGQAAFNKTIVYLNEIPENYVSILSGLGSSSPRYLLIIPVVFNNETIAVIELASFKEMESKWNKLFDELAIKIGESLIKYLE
ncbi:MAG: GAF domain-containing protein [Bacteroidales bacterium]